MNLLLFSFIRITQISYKHKPDLNDCTVSSVHRATFAGQVLALCITSISSIILHESSKSPKITIRSFENIHLKWPLKVLFNICFVQNVV